ncbi:hypothetical protein BRC94_11270 [Halobacteriales archaeon QS_5_70_17]|nr:MAG: hypothetical protein BRC94_11270 [Halobacteriales archaeon QS_5_70_17]
MTDRIQHDHSSIDSHRATVERAGRTDRPKVVLPEGVAAPDDPVRIVLDGRAYRAVIETDFGDVPEIRGVYDNARMAREREGPNRLAEWVESSDLSFGRSVHLDVIESGAHYGFRTPGETAVYEPTAGPDGSLADIASDLE